MTRAHVAVARNIRLVTVVTSQFRLFRRIVFWRPLFPEVIWNQGVSFAKNFGTVAEFAKNFGFRILFKNNEILGEFRYNCHLYPPFPYQLIVSIHGFRR